MAETDPDDAIAIKCPACEKQITAPAPSETAKALRFRCVNCLVTVYVNRESPALKRALQEA